MNGTYIIVGSIILILVWHLGAADNITTTIISAGATFLTTAMVGPDQAYSNHLFTDDWVNLSRYLDTGKGVDSTVKVTGYGTIGVDEYRAQTRSTRVTRVLVTPLSERFDYNEFPAQMVGMPSLSIFPILNPHRFDQQGNIKKHTRETGT